MTGPSTVKWTDEEMAFAFKAANARPIGKPLAEVSRDIAAALGKSGKAVEQKLARLLMSPETKARRAEMERARYAKRVQDCNPYGNRQIVIFRPTPEMIDARDARSNAGPRDLTGAIAGDPPVGYSALERRA